MSRQTHLLDCTLRDGSYLIDYHFTADDTYVIASALASAGLARIEVGHGLGLDAQKKGKGKAADSDERYVEASVAAASGRSKIGVFYIPGTGELDSIRRAFDKGLGFIRIGTNIEELEQAAPAIALAKKLGLETWSNLMKSYVVPPEGFAARCKLAQEMGADVVALVDSAGGMTPGEISLYAEAACSRLTIPLGFHGHNNLQLAVANCLAGSASGIAFFDATLRGMGRSAGNAPLEVIASVFAREGHDIGPVDWQRLIELADKLVAPMMPRDTGLLPMEIASGLAYFHSSFQKLVDESSKQHHVPSYATIIQLGPKGRAGVTQQMAENAAASVVRAAHDEPVSDVRWLARRAPQQLDSLLESMDVLSAKTGYVPVISASRNASLVGRKYRFTPLRVGSGFCIAHIESKSKATDRELFGTIAARIPWWVVDRRIARDLRKPESVTMLHYDDDWLTISAVLDFVNTHAEVKSVALSSPRSEADTSDALMSALAHTARVVKKQADLGIVWGPMVKRWLADLRKGASLLILKPSAIRDGLLDSARLAGFRVFRPDFSELLLSEISRLIRSYRRFKEHSGEATIAGVPVVAGGYIGARGVFIVDSISRPTMIIGKADGNGGVLSLSPSDTEVVSRLQSAIVSRVNTDA
jgi:4-hydroxy-2-oxovalerate aldolase